MSGLIEQLFGAGFMPHGHCYLWTPGLLWTQVAANGLIAGAYFMIAAGLAVMVRRIDDMPFGWMYWAFALFIFACGVTHAFDVLVIWKPYYWIDAVVRVVTAAASVATAVLLVPLVPKAVTLIRGGRSAMEKGMRLDSVVEDLESMYEKTKQLERQKTRFFANVSHELRTPLTLVLGRARRLLDEGDLEGDEREAVSSILDNSRLLLKHVDDLLDIARFEAERLEMEVEAFDFDGLVRRVVGTFDGLADECDIDYRIEGPEGIDVEMDRTQIESILMNLLSNAFKFTPDGGTIRIEYEVAEEASDGAGRVELAVNDSGPGVPPEEREAVFERFRQVDIHKANRFGGTGLGLVVVRNFVELHGGEVYVEKAPEGGARFVVTLPTEVTSAEAEEGEQAGEAGRRSARSADEEAADLFVDRVSEARRPTAPQMLDHEAPEKGEEHRESEPEEGEQGETEASPSEGDGERPQVLVVEDNRQMNSFICELLAEDFATRSAYDGREALAAVEERAVDVIVTDIMMPEVDGVEMIEELNADEGTADIPILVLTARADDELRTELLRKGADDFIPKPFSNDELVARVSNLEAVRKTRSVLQEELESQREDIAELATELSDKKAEVEEALEEARMAWRQAERASEAKTEFLGMVSHELRTPLTTMQMQLELMRLRAEAPLEERREIIERMQTPLDRLLGVVEGLLKRASLESGRMEVEPTDVDLGVLVDEAVDEVRDRAEEKGLELEVERGDDVGAAQTDPKVLGLVVGNLLDNAVKFTDEGEVGVRVDRRAGEHVIRVRDTGRGIKPTEQSAIFQAFARGREDVSTGKPGAGLGLNLVREAVHALGGKIEMESEMGVGSTFTVVLPFDTAPAARAGE